MDLDKKIKLEIEKILKENFFDESLYLQKFNDASAEGDDANKIAVFSDGILIFMQKKDATRVAGYKKWREANRGVKRNPTRIQILAPRFSGADPAKDVKDKELADEIRRNRRPVNFFPVTVFDVSDTYPLNEKGEIPDTPQWHGESGENEYADKLTEAGMEMARSMGIAVEEKEARGGEKGSSSGDNIVIVQGSTGAGRFSIFIHELAHELLHKRELSIFSGRKKGESILDDLFGSRDVRSIRELQAESVAYVVCKHYELPTEYQPTYLALWKADKEKIKNNLDVITKASIFIIDGIDKYMKK